MGDACVRNRPVLSAQVVEIVRIDVESVRPGSAGSGVSAPVPRPRGAWHAPTRTASEGRAMKRSARLLLCSLMLAMGAPALGGAALAQVQTQAGYQR